MGGVIHQLRLRCYGDYYQGGEAIAIRLIVTVNAAPGKGSEWAKVYPDRCADTEKEPGCEHFESSQSLVNSDKIVLLER
jgi:quinol monooxygenase YgiN